ncbi:hypothetical protein BDZ97DRAFT_1694461 [Flammula alnicola]|nr:hypothetical protein BDZ97DRAFT_1694461 [Flammula alnicola]
MTSVLSAVSSDFDDHSRPETPVATSVAQIPTIEAPESPLAVDQLDGPSLASTLKLPDSSSQFLSPVPASKPEWTFCLADVLDGSGSLENILGPEIGAVDITVAADGSFIETSSGQAARELKRRYDQLAGVGPSVRSPYAITAFINQHGKSMYRIGYRDEHSAPAASAAQVEERISQSKTSSDASQSPRTKRRSRLSMHFPPAMFSKNTAAPVTRPPTANSSTSSSGRKLRKTRSIPDMSSAEATVTSAPTFAVTGRAHSQSVTAVDLPRPSMPFSIPPTRQVDSFGELMDWFTPSSSALSNFSSNSLFNPGKVSSDQDRPRATVIQPFGHGVTFNAPSQKPALDRLPTPRHLREMQSFESGLTARQVDSHNDLLDNLPDNQSPIPSEPSESDNDTTRPPSAIRLSTVSSSVSVVEDPADAPEAPEPDFTPSAESLRLSSHYSTEVFNVLQTYRGLPLFEKLVPESDEGTTVIKLSLAADQSAAPRDDPRFVIWGETLPDQDLEDYHSTSRDSLTDLSQANLSSSSISKRRSSRVSRLKSPETSSSKLPPINGQKVLLAATIERWIAQLTSDLNYDELLNFFLTYRTYVSAVDLCHLLICRFHWALQQPSSLQDETVRRIVRVRTFVAIRYWLLTFFTVDFIPNRELRLLIADWLNTLIHDPILKKHNDGIDIVRRLVKVAKECKRAHTRTVEKPKPTSPPKEAEEQPVDHLLGKSFAEAIRKTSPDDDSSDLDLDFLPDEAKAEDSPTGFPSDPANAHLIAGHGVGGVLSASRPTSLPLSSLNILHRTDHAPGPTTDAESQFVQNAMVPLTIRHSALSRAFVRTIGRLGRWKRVLNPRSSIRPASLGACGAGVSAFDLEISAARDLLSMNGGVEQYLKMSEPSAKTAPPSIVIAPGTPTLSTLPPIPPLPTTPPPVPYTNGTHSSPQSPLASLNFTNNTTDTPTFRNESSTVPTLSPQLPPAYAAESIGEAPADPEVTFVTLDEIDHVENDVIGNSASEISRGSFSEEVDQLREAERPESFRSSSTDSFGAPLTLDGPLPPTFPGKHNQWQFDVVSIDDLDFSDTSSIPPEDLAYPPGLRKPPRKLPMRRDFEFVRRSEVSSMGIVSHESMRDSITSSTHSESSPSSSGPPKPIHRWQMKSLQQTFESLSNDGEDNGDVEAALRRLEGQINPKIQQEKAEKVDGWVRTLQERMANGDYDYESSLFSEDDIEGFIDEVDPSAVGTEANGQPNVVISASTMDDVEYDQEAIDPSTHTPIPTQTAHQLPPPDPDASPRSKDSKPAVEDVVPLEILQSRMTPSLETPAPTLVNPSVGTLSSKFANPDGPRIHRSFILNSPTETLAEHFSMIDRELFMSVKFEELVTDEWVECEEINILDWAQYLKDRARWKVEARFTDKTTALAAVRARFNLMVAFVISEVVLTPPTERPIVVSKFIRIAWKSYSLSNFNTLTAIITALQNEWVTKAMRKQGWSRIGIFESRMYRDLKQFTSNVDDFKFMRQVIDSIVDSKPLENSNHAASVVSGDSQSGKGKAGTDNRPAIPSACIPFIGIYLSQLHRLNKLPALIDPTAPNSVIGIDPVTAVFDPPTHPEVFSALAPLPPSMHLEPLINVHKQRRIADVIKSLVAGQHLASRVQFDIDKKLFQRCLRLRGLDSVTLQRALAMYPD